MKNSINLFAWILYSTLCFTGIVACAEKDKDSDQIVTIDCNIDKAECLTNGDRQVYYMFSSDGDQMTNACFLSIQMGFNMDGTFTWTSDSDVDEQCLNLIGFENFTGQWTLENEKSEIHITPPWYPNHGQAQTVLEVIELDETRMVAKTPSQGEQIHEIVWKRLD